jgi:hypothetical protein
MQKAHGIPKDLRSTLENLANGIFPLQSWVVAKTYKPPDANALPWRQAGTNVSLSPVSIGALDYFDTLLQSDEDARNAEVSARWLRLQPLKAVKGLKGRVKWRVDRGLAPEVSFGAVQSDNVLVTESVPGAPPQPSSRRDFYRRCWPRLRKVMQQKTPTDWGTFATDLFADANASWPKTKRPSSKEFIKVFAKDLINGMIEMRVATGGPWKFALLIELGEYRRVGNKYTELNAQQSVDAFKAVLP